MYRGNKEIIKREKNKLSKVEYESSSGGKYRKE